jgi:hypothetical protein
MEAYHHAAAEKRKGTGRDILTVEEHSDLFRDTLAKRGLEMPDCSELMKQFSDYDGYRARMAELDPLCDTYSSAAMQLDPHGVSAEHHERLFKENASRWRIEKQRSPEVIALVDKLLALPTTARGLSIRKEIQAYMAVPGMFYNCTRLVWDAEDAAGLPRSDIE